MCVRGFCYNSFISYVLVTAVGLGTWRYSQLVYGPALGVLYVFWIYISFNVVYIIWDTFMYIYAKCICPGDGKNNKKKSKEDSFEMKPMKMDSNAKEDTPKKEPSKVECKGWSLSLQSYRVTCVGRSK